MQSAKNAYEVVRFIRDKGIHRMMKISEPAVFKSCRRLADSGYLDGKTVRVAGVPDKVVYTINKNGRRHFNDLMLHFSQELKPFYLEFNTVIWNIESLDKAAGKKMLATLQQQIHQLKEWIIEHEEEVREHLGFGPRRIVKQYRMTISALADWIDETVQEYSN